jgi:uncharacterized protein (DUF1684 family)
MAIVPEEKVPPSSPADAFVADWERWHLRRLEVLTAVDGPPTLAATSWLADSNVVPGVDGTWSNGDDGVELLLGEGSEVLVNGERTRGRVVALSPGGLVGPRLVFASLTAQVTTRQGRRGVRVFDHARAGRLQGLGTYRPDPSFVLKGTYEALPGHSSVSYSYALESSPREVEVPGVVHFTLSGSDYAVTPFLDEGLLLLVFADSTTGTGTRPPSRFLLIEPPAEGLGQTGPVVLDFNRAFLPPCAFSDEFNCPLPPAHHRLGTGVTVGETWARFTDQAPSHDVEAEEAEEADLP